MRTRLMALSVIAVVLGLDAGPGAVAALAGGSPSTVTLTSSTGGASTFGQPVTFTASVVPAGATGTVQFSDGATPLGTPINLDVSGQATYTTSALLVGSHTITAAYSGDGTYGSSTSPPLVQTVTKAGTSVNLTDFPAATTSYGQQIIFTATVNSSVGTPTGTVQFQDGATPLQTIAVDASGQAKLITTTLPIGSHSIRAVYSGDANYVGSTSGTVSHTVAQTNTSTTVSASPTSPVSGQSVTLTATVSPTVGSGTPSGTVAFSDSGSGLAGCGAVALTSGTAQCAVTLLAGSHSIAAGYSGDPNFQTSNGTMSFNVGRAASAVTLSAASGAPIAGATVTYTTTVAAAPPGGGSPTGTVSYTEDGSALSGCTGLSLSSPQCSVTYGAPTTHTIAVAYSGDAQFTGGSASLNVTVTRDPTATSVTSGTTAAPVGAPVTFTSGVTVSGPEPATGTVTYNDSSVPLAGCSGMAVGTPCTATFAVPGTHHIAASYSGDALTAPSISPVFNIDIAVAGTSTTLTDNPTSGVTGQPIGLSATVAVGPPGGGALSGTVTITDSGSPVPGCSALPLSGNVATCNPGFSAGTHTLVATYSGDSGHGSSSSTSVTLPISPAATTTSVTASPGTSVTGQSVTYSATVTAVSPGAGTPAGTVAFADSGTTIASCANVTLSNGVATCTVTYGSAGVHHVTAAYAATSDYTGSGSSTIDHTVSPAPTQISISPPPSPVVVGQSITLSATVTVLAPGAGVPLGTVGFTDQGQPITTCSAQGLSGSGSSATATCTIAWPAVGNHQIQGAYGGSADYAGSNTATATVISVQPASTTTAVTSSVDPAVTGQSITFTATVTANPPGSGTPTQTVDVQDSGTTLAGCSGMALSGGSATCSTPLSVGSHTITAVYSGSSDYLGSTSSSITETVHPASTSTVLSADSNPVAALSPVVYTANVSAISPGAGTVDGGVTFTDGGSAITACTGVPLSGGIAQCSQTYPTVGTHAIAAYYTGTAMYVNSNSGTLNEAVSALSTSTTLSYSPASPQYGNAVTLTATVTHVGPALPTGTVSFLDGTTSLGTGSVDTSGHATLNVPLLPGGSHSLSAQYNGDSTFAASTSPAVNVTVSPAPSTATIAASPNPSIHGAPVSIAATVAPGSGSSGATPTGTVTFRDGFGSIGTATLDASGKATLVTSGLSRGSHSLSIDYAGDGNYQPSSSPVISQTVVSAPSTTSLSATPSSPVVGQSVTYTAGIAIPAPGGGQVSGTVSIADGSQPLAGCQNLPVVSGTATCTAPAGSVGNHSLVASFQPDSASDAAPSASPPMAESVAQASTSTALSSGTTGPVTGQTVVLTAVVNPSAPASGTPTGAVAFTEGGLPIAGCGSVPLTSGQAQCSVTYPAVGNHSLVASYGGSADYHASASPATNLVVSAAATTTAVTSSTNPGTAGNAITYTATVTPSSPGSGTPSGTATFRDGFVAISTCTGVTLTNGTAACVVIYGTAGTHSISAHYGGDGNFGGSDSPALAENVVPAPTTTVIGASTNPVTYGNTVSLTATVTDTHGGAAGSVVFTDGGGNLGSATLGSGGSGTLTVTAPLAAGSHSIVASYGGNSSDGASSSSPLTLTVNPVATTTTVGASPNPASHGNTVTISAQVTPTSGSGLEPSGSVSFVDGSSPLGSATLTTAGVATISINSLARGTHQITASYGADANHLGSTSAPYNLTIQAAASTTTVSFSPTTVAVDQPTTFAASVAFLGSGSGVIAGTILFTDNGQSIPGCPPATVSGGSATCTGEPRSAGPSSIVANFQPSSGSDAAASSSAGANLAVSPAGTTTTASEGASASVTGQVVTYTAAVGLVSPSVGLPSGSVTFKDAGYPISTCTGMPLNSSGVASCSLTYSGAGTHVITAYFPGTSDFTASLSPPVNHTVSRATTSTSLASAQNPAYVGAPVALQATVAVNSPGGGTPTGTVTITDNGTAITPCTALPLGVSGTVSCTTAFASPATHPLTATYSGDSGYASSASSSLSQSVLRVPTTSSVTATPASTTFGQMVTLTATVTTSNNTAPSGTVNFTSDGTTLGSASLRTDGTASISLSTPPPGSHAIVAHFIGTTGLAPSDSPPTTLDITTAPTTTTLQASPTQAVHGQAIVVTAHVQIAGGGGSLAPPPTGTVMFEDGGVAVANGTVDSSGTATVSIATLSVGGHALSAHYEGDANDSASDSAPTSVSVALAGSRVSLESTVAGPVTGQALTYTATIAEVAPGSGNASGSITIFADGNALVGCTDLVVTNGQAACDATAGGAGTHQLTATFTPDPQSDAAGSTAPGMTQTVIPAATSIALASDPDSGLVDHPVTITANVSITQPGGGDPTGSVAFSANGSILCVDAVVNGQASCPTSFASADTLTLTATYDGDANFSGSKASRPEVVGTAATSTDLVAPATSIVGDTVSFVATVSDLSGGSAPTGTVTFTDGGRILSSCDAASIDAAGVARCEVTYERPGTHDIAATYNGDAARSRSTSAPAVATIDLLPTTTDLTASTDTAFAGDPITLTANVGGSGVLTGGVIFRADNQIIATVAVDPQGNAALTVTSLVAGSHSLDALYGGDLSHGSSQSGALGVTINGGSPSDAGSSPGGTATTPSPEGGHVDTNFSASHHTLGGAVSEVHAAPDIPPAAPSVTRTLPLTLDASKIPLAGALGAGRVFDLIDPISIWGYLVAINVCAMVLLGVQRRRWRGDLDDASPPPATGPQEEAS